jgi:hypothetical protein
VRIRLISSGIVRSNERSPASTWATGMPSFTAASVAASVELTSPTTSTACGRPARSGRARCHAARRRSARRASPSRRRGSRPAPACRGRGRRHPTWPRRSAGRCGPAGSRRRAAPQLAQQRRHLHEVRARACDDDDLDRESRREPHWATRGRSPGESGITRSPGRGSAASATSSPFCGMWVVKRTRAPSVRWRRARSQDWVHDLLPVLRDHPALGPGTSSRRAAGLALGDHEPVHLGRTLRQAREVEHHLLVGDDVPPRARQAVLAGGWIEFSPAPPPSSRICVSW